ncbi:MAG TPA: SCP2 sterol-binding domain-containing protein [Acidimicrobiia bacterium]
MLQFLSPEWLQAFDAALRAEPGLGARFAASPIAIAQEVANQTGTEARAEPVRYVVVLDGAGGRVESGAGAPPADVTFICDRATAAELARGEVNAQRALTSGRLKLRGEVDRLAAASSALAGLGDLLESLRENTHY